LHKSSDASIIRKNDEMNFYHENDISQDNTCTSIELTQTEVALRESEARLQEAQRIARLGNWEWNIIAGEEQWSEEMFRLLGLVPDKDRITHETLENAIHPEDRDLVLQAIEQTIYNDKPYQIEFRILRGDGHIRYVQAFGKLIRETTGRPMRLLGTAQDITERKQAEAALKDSEARLAEVQRIARLGNWSWDLQTGEEQWSEEMFRVLGLSPLRDQITHETFEKALHPEDREAVLQAIEQTISNHKPYQLEFKIIGYDGILRHVQAFGKLIRDVDGKPLRLLGTAQEITERKQAEIALRESEKFRRTLIETSLIGLVMFNRHGLIIEANSAFATIIGYTLEEVIRRLRDSNIIPQHHDQPLASVMAQGRFGPCEREFIHKQGHLVPVRLSGLVIEHKNESFFWVNVEDITDQRQTELALRQAKETAEVANRAKSAFLANMSHELRTPLNGILGYTQILRRDKQLTSQQQEGIDIIHRSGEYLLTLINDILDLSKVEAGKIELYPSNFYLNEFLKGLRDLFRMRAEEKGISFIYKALTPLPPVIRADEKRLRQILINLLSNAMKFTQRGGVYLKVSYHQDHMRFQVEDTGVGIAPEEIKKIFLPFQQVGDFNYRTEGTGLGLSISQKLIEMMGGSLHVDSVPGKGSIFWTELNLPEVSDLEKHHTHEPVIIGIQGSPRTILVVDDTKENCMVLYNLLSPLGFKVIEASNGKESIEKAKIYLPDLILMDLVMSVIDGFEATRQIRRLVELKNTIIIAISASAFDYHQQQSREAGCDDFIAKPIRAEILLERLQAHLNLEWIYKQTERSEPALMNEDMDQPETVPLEGLNRQQLEILFDLVMSGNINGIIQYVEQLQNQNQQARPFAQKIYQLAKQLEMKQIRKLIKEYKEQLG